MLTWSVFTYFVIYKVLTPVEESLCHKNYINKKFGGSNLEIISLCESTSEFSNPLDSMIDFKKQMKLSYIVPDVLFFQPQINSRATSPQTIMGHQR